MHETAGPSQGEYRRVQRGGCLVSRRAAKGNEGARFVDPKANTAARSAEGAR
jgi:hypothetical protein